MSPRRKRRHTPGSDMARLHNTALHESHWSAVLAGACLSAGCGAIVTRTWWAALAMGFSAGALAVITAATARTETYRRIAAHERLMMAVVRAAQEQADDEANT